MGLMGKSPAMGQRKEGEGCSGGSPGCGGEGAQPGWAWRGRKGYCWGRGFSAAPSLPSSLLDSGLPGNLCEDLG